MNEYFYDDVCSIISEYRGSYLFHVIHEVFNQSILDILIRLSIYNYTGNKYAYSRYGPETLRVRINKQYSTTKQYTPNMKISDLSALQPNIERLKKLMGGEFVSGRKLY